MKVRVSSRSASGLAPSAVTSFSILLAAFVGGEDDEVRLRVRFVSRR